MLKNRDAKFKQALIDYLNQDTDERLWQAINNFGEEHGLCAHFLITGDNYRVRQGDICVENPVDLFFQESDKKFKESDGN